MLLFTKLCSSPVVLLILPFDGWKVTWLTSGAPMQDSFLDIPLKQASPCLVVPSQFHSTPQTFQPTVPTGFPFMSIFDSAFELEGAYATSGLALSYDSNDTSILSVTSDGLLQPAGQGLVRITANQPGNAYFTAATPVVYNMKIMGKRSQTFPFPHLVRSELIKHSTSTRQPRQD